MSSSTNDPTGEPSSHPPMLEIQTSETTERLRKPYFFDVSLFPFFQPLIDNMDLIRQELLALGDTAPKRTVAAIRGDFDQWLGDNEFDKLPDLLEQKGGGWMNWWNNDYEDPKQPNLNWTIFAFCAGQGRFIETNCQRCPHTAELLRAIPCLRVAGFSRLEPNTLIDDHTGFTGLSHNALAFHLGLIIPSDGKCGLKVGPCTHLWRKPGEAIVFDDTFVHRAWNNSQETRVILYIDFEVDEQLKSMLAIDEEPPKEPTNCIVS